MFPPTPICSGESPGLAAIALPEGHVHVWKAVLDVPAPVWLNLRQTLSAAELARADKIISDRHRRHFIAGRGWLRLLLGSYLQTAPARIRLAGAAHGKPCLVTANGAGSLRFNLSHAHGLAVYALARTAEIGIDLEYVRPDFPMDTIAGRCFAPAELEALRAAPLSRQTALFYRTWVRKEAYAKAVGLGLALPFRRFDVSGAPARPVKDDSAWPAGEPWHIVDLETGAEYAAALAVPGRGWRISYGSTAGFSPAFPTSSILT
jgi:4'-phosphopantetheinyl transferase